MKTSYSIVTRQFSVAWLSIALFAILLLANFSVIFASEPIVPSSPQYPAVKDAIEKIKEYAPELGEHLEDELENGNLHLDDISPADGHAEDDKIVLDDDLFRSNGSAKNPWYIAGLLIHENTHLGERVYFM